MVTIENTRKILGYENGVQVAVVDLNVSTEAELPHLGDIVEGTKIAPNTYATITRTGAWMKIDENDKWYYCDGSGEVSAASTQNVSLNMASPEAIEHPGFGTLNTEVEPQETAEPEGGDDDAELL